MTKKNPLLLSALALFICCALAPGICAAASATILPLVNRTTDREATAVYLKEAAKAVELKPGFSLVKDGRVLRAAAKYAPQTRLPDAFELERIAKEAGIDAVIAMELSEMRKAGDSFVLSGLSCGYNGPARKSYRREFKGEPPGQSSLSSRWEWRHAAWAKAVRRETERILSGR